MWFCLFVRFVTLCVPILYICLFYDIVHPLSNLWRWLQSESTKKNMTSRCQYVLKKSVIWDDGYLYNNGKKGPKKCVFVCSFVWLYCASPLCTVVYFMTSCVHTLIHEDDFKVKTLKRIWPQGATMFLKYLWYEMVGIYIIMERRVQKKCVFVGLFVWIHCASPLCTFVYFMTLCFHTLIC